MRVLVRSPVDSDSPDFAHAGAVAIGVLSAWPWGTASATGEVGALGAAAGLVGWGEEEAPSPLPWTRPSLSTCPHLPESLHVWAHTLLFLSLCPPQRSERDACAARTEITLLRAPPRGPDYLERPAQAAQGLGAPQGPACCCSWPWERRAPQPGALALLALLSMLHSFEPLFPPFPFCRGLGFKL